MRPKTMTTRSRQQRQGGSHRTAYPGTPDNPNPTFTPGSSGNPQSGFGQPAVGSSNPGGGGADGGGAGGDGGGSGGGPSPFDFSSDPILQQIMAEAQRQMAEAQANALAKREQLAVAYGDASGLGLDKSYETAAANNPFSVIHNAKRSYDQGVVSLEDALNKDNLFYSGARGTKLGEAATGFQRTNYGNQQRFRGSLQDVQSTLAQALQSARYMEMSGQEGAYARALSAALAGGYAGGGGGSGGGGGGGGGGGSGTSSYGTVVYRGTNADGSPYYTTSDNVTHEGTPEGDAAMKLGSTTPPLVKPKVQPVLSGTQIRGGV